MSYYSSGTRTGHGSHREKHHSNKGSHSGKHSDKHRSSKPGKQDRTNTSSSHQGSQLLSFLFVVNEITLYSGDTAPYDSDQWGTIIPPTDPFRYAGETPGIVFRYRDGRVEETYGYDWVRDNTINQMNGLRPAGRIVCRPPDSDEEYFMPEYSTYTVFHCWRPLPCVYVETDPMSRLIGPLGDGLRWNLMSFEMPDNTGITRISSAGPSQVVCGNNASWIPSLVPSMFKNSNGPPSVGLAGELPVIIGQMALNWPRHYTDTPFLSQLWHRGRWTPPARIETVDTPTDIRGVLVHVALDSWENGGGSTEEALNLFERSSTIVRG
ncbi:hypothetical protein F5Y19DRAFT_456599 [Xylariaceae sp. FL1651]|nr:hypothetical protein F5Y19DRAFT_456599 [Xylariaceae sp. FL1651]